jgi:hypothetical protein
VAAKCEPIRRPGSFLSRLSVPNTGPTSSTWIRRQPNRGFSLAAARRASRCRRPLGSYRGGGAGRSSAATKRGCQVRSVSGLIGKQDQRPRRTRRLRAARAPAPLDGRVSASPGARGRRTRSEGRPTRPPSPLRTNTTGRQARASESARRRRWPRARSCPMPRLYASDGGWSVGVPEGSAHRPDPVLDTPIVQPTPGTVGTIGIVAMNRANVLPSRLKSHRGRKPVRLPAGSSQSW